MSLKYSLAKLVYEGCRVDKCFLFEDSCKYTLNIDIFHEMDFCGICQSKENRLGKMSLYHAVIEIGQPMYSVNMTNSLHFYPLKYNNQ